MFVFQVLDSWLVDQEEWIYLLRFRRMIVMIWDPGILSDVWQLQFVGLHHQVLSLYLTRDEGNGKDKNELETSSYAVEANDVT